MGGVARIFTPEAKLKKSIRAHFTRLGFTKADDGTLVLPEGGKEIVRQLHAGQRAERLRDSREFLKRSLPKALPHFANGVEIDPSKIQLGLIRVHSGSKDADLFRVASLTWSVPVSAGFGCRMRYRAALAAADPGSVLCVDDLVVRRHLATAVDRVRLSLS